jgi:hypothetical protein
MRCVNWEQCGNHLEPNDDRTYWEAIVAVRDRDGGGPNRRSLKRTGQGWCVECSIRLEYNVPAGQGSLFE